MLKQSSLRERALAGPFSCCGTAPEGILGPHGSLWCPEKPSKNGFLSARCRKAIDWAKAEGSHGAMRPGTKQASPKSAPARTPQSRKGLRNSSGAVPQQRKGPCGPFLCEDCLSTEEFLNPPGATGTLRAPCPSSTSQARRRLLPSCRWRRTGRRGRRHGRWCRRR